MDQFPKATFNASNQCASSQETAMVKRVKNHLLMGELCHETAQECWI